MSRPIIEVSGLSKRYRIGVIGATSLREEFQRSWDRLRGRKEPDANDFWALRDVSFEVRPGEVVGVIGRNGAGKSTLLKILARITEPTSGRAVLRGRAASLLEVGTGFHPELTGRENIFLNGAILGMTRAEVRQKFDEIVAFAEVEQFIDTPVKRYSSGMYVRLAFAVAAHLEPEILIIDEVLAVGDAQFQQKCLGKMRAVATGEGRTVLFVSHDMAAISTLTQHCLLLEAGRVRSFAPTADAVTEYFSRHGRIELAYAAEGPAPARPRIAAVTVETSESPGIQAAGQPLTVRIDLEHAEPLKQGCLSFQIVNQFQQPATHLWLYGTDTPFGSQPGRTRLECRLPRVRLNVGHYALKLYFSEPPGGQMFEILEHVCPFEVVRLDATTLWGWRPEACAYHEEGEWTVSPC
jgi:lipopolysaccharide transport system ATP-binding protein